MLNNEDQGQPTGNTVQEAPLAKAKAFLILASSVTFDLVKFIHLILQKDLKFLRHHLPGCAVSTHTQDLLAQLLLLAFRSAGFVEDHNHTFL